MKTHPDPSRLRDFALGRLAPEVAADVEAHVAGCAACCAHLAAAPDDTFVGRLRGAKGDETVAPDLTAPRPNALPAGLVDHPTYQILGTLGAGGMGVVYRAVHRLMEREVAVKVINAGLIDHPAAVERFRQEMKAAARLSHPNVVAAHDAGQAGDVHFLVMEYVEGVSLDRLVSRKGPLPAAQACHFARQAALGLQHAHEKGMVHRDVKPHNLMVTRKGQVKVLDFGLARVAEEAHATNKRQLTAVGTILGTPDYLAPEQVSDARNVDVRADVYSLGCTLYFLLAGRPPFPEGNALEKALSHVDGVPTPLRQLRPDVPPELMVVLDKMMAKSPDARHQTPGEAAQALAAFAKASPKPAAEAATVELPRPRKRRASRRTAGLLLAGAAVVGMLAAVGLVTVVASALSGGGQDRPSGVVQPVAGAKHRVLVVLPSRDFWWPDYEGIDSALRGEADVEVTVASSRPGWATPKHEQRANGGAKDVKVGRTLDEAEAADYDAVVFSGGPRTEYLGEGRAARRARGLATAMRDRGGVVAGVCNGVGVLAEAELLRGKRAAGHSSASGVIAANGGRFVEDRLVEHGDVITGSEQGSADVGRAVLARLRQRRQESER